MNRCTWYQVASDVPIPVPAAALKPPCTPHLLPCVVMQYRNPFPQGRMADPGLRPPFPSSLQLDC